MTTSEILEFASNNYNNLWSNPSVTGQKAEKSRLKLRTLKTPAPACIQEENANLDIERDCVLTGICKKANDSSKYDFEMNPNRLLNYKSCKLEHSHKLVIIVHARNSKDTTTTKETGKDISTQTERDMLNASTQTEDFPNLRELEESIEEAISDVMEEYEENSLPGIDFDTDEFLKMVEEMPEPTNLTIPTTLSMEITTPNSTIVPTSANTSIPMENPTTIPADPPIPTLTNMPIEELLLRPPMGLMRTILPVPPVIPTPSITQGIPMRTMPPVPLNMPTGNITQGRPLRNILPKPPITPKQTISNKQVNSNQQNNTTINLLLPNTTSDSDFEPTTKKFRTPKTRASGETEFNPSEFNPDKLVSAINSLSLPTQPFICINEVSQSIETPAFNLMVNGLDDFQQNEKKQAPQKNKGKKRKSQPSFQPGIPPLKKPNTRSAHKRSS